MPKARFGLGIISLAIGCFALLFGSLLATLSVSKLLGILMLIAGALFVVRLSAKLKQLRTAPNISNLAALYLITIPESILVFQLLLAKSLTKWSRNKAIDNAQEYMPEIENYLVKYGGYPVGLQV